MAISPVLEQAGAIAAAYNLLTQRKLEPTMALVSGVAPPCLIWRANCIYLCAPFYLEQPVEPELRLGTKVRLRGACERSHE